MRLFEKLRGRYPEIVNKPVKRPSYAEGLLDDQLEAYGFYWDEDNQTYVCMKGAPVSPEDPRIKILRRRASRTLTILPGTKPAFEGRGVPSEIVEEVEKLLQKELVEDALDYASKVEEDLHHRIILVESLGESMNLGMQASLKTKEGRLPDGYLIFINEWRKI